MLSSPLTLEVGEKWELRNKPILDRHSRHGTSLMTNITTPCFALLFFCGGNKFNDKHDNTMLFFFWRGFPPPRYSMHPRMESAHLLRGFWPSSRTLMEKRPTPSSSKVISSGCQSSLSPTAGTPRLPPPPPAASRTAPGPKHAFRLLWKEDGDLKGWGPGVAVGDTWAWCWRALFGALEGQDRGNKRPLCLRLVLGKAALLGSRCDGKIKI